MKRSLLLFAISFWGIALSLAQPIDLSGYRYRQDFSIGVIGVQTVQTEFLPGGVYEETYDCGYFKPMTQDTPFLRSFLSVGRGTYYAERLPNGSIVLRLGYGEVEHSILVSGRILNFDSADSGIAITDGGFFLGSFRLILGGGSPAQSGTFNCSQRIQLTRGVPATLGFVLNGEGRKQVLIRAVTSSLTSFGVVRVAGGADFQVQACDSSNELPRASSWRRSRLSEEAYRHLFAQLGAFPLGSDSEECADLLNLRSGAYSVLVTLPEGAQEGECLLEIYISQ